MYIPEIHVQAIPKTRKMTKTYAALLRATAFSEYVAYIY
jgi:hypothetical protein